MLHTNLLINGRDICSANGDFFECKSPLDGSVVTRSPRGRADDARKAVEAASAAFPSWSATPPKERRDCLLRAAEALRAASDTIINAMVAETGATKTWAQFNLKLGCDLLVEAAAMTTQLTGDIIPSNNPGCLSLAMREPWGVCLGIAPWNAPIILFVRAFAMPLACGNTVVLKSSELCPGTHALIAKAVSEDILPPGVVNVIVHDASDAEEVVSALVSDPAVRHINFTGSTRVGRIIASQAGLNLKPILLELGGKSPMLVLEDAEIGDAVAAAAFGAFMHQGQICMATGRIIVNEHIAEDFVQRLVRKTNSLTTGDPSGNAQLGGLIDVASVARVASLVEDAVAKGASCLAGGTSKGTLFAPTVLDNVTPKMKIYHDEVFGPVASVVRVKSDEEAIAVANDTEYGLASSVFSTNVSRAVSLCRKIESGICHINGATVHDEAQVPFGGVKSSGYGRFGGRGGLEAFTYLRWVTVETRSPHYPI